MRKPALDDMKNRELQLPTWSYSWSYLWII